MKKLIFVVFTMTTVTFSAQELTNQMKTMIKSDNTDEFSTFIKAEDINKCFNIKGDKYSLLSLAIKMDSEKFFDKLVSEKADLNFVCDNKTPLMFAAKYGKTEMLKELLKNGADKSAKSSSRGETAMDYAVKYKQSEIIELLK